jgi:hypothetical protein
MASPQEVEGIYYKHSRSVGIPSTILLLKRVAKNPESVS